MGKREYKDSVNALFTIVRSEEAEGTGRGGALA